MSLRFRSSIVFKDYEKVDKNIVGEISSKVLSNSYVNPNFSNDQDNSPLIYFCKIECVDAVKLLIQYNANVNHIGVHRKTATHHVMKINGNNMCLIDRPT